MTPPPPLLEETRRCAQSPALITSGRPRVEEKVLTIVGDRFRKAAEKNRKSIGKIIMGGQLLKLGLLLLSVAYSSSMDPKTSIAPEMATDSAETLPSLSMDSPLVALKDGPLTDKVSTFVDPSAKELMTAGGSIKELKGVPEQETSTAPEATQEETSTDRADAVTIRSNTSGPLVAALNVNTPSDNDTTFIGTTTREPVMPSTKESTTTPEQEAKTPEKILGEETTTTAKATMAIDSTTSKDPSSGTVSTGPEPITVPTGLTFTSQDNTTNDDETTSSSSIQPTGGAGTSKPLFTQGPNKNTQPPKNPRKLSDDDKRKITIVVVVLIVLLFLVLVTVVVVLVRKRRRSGSQSFHRNSSKDVWAGQVPQLGEGKVAQHQMGVANGAAGNKAEPGQEQEMITFISAEKKEDSSVEVNEMGKGDTSEKKPLLEETSQEKEKPPVQEQTPE